MPRILLCLLLILTCTSLFAQQLRKPRAIELAYKKGTRSMDGTLGKNYWQNYGRYNISMIVSPPNRTIYGTEQLVYFNKSPDSLNTLVFDLICNVHKPGAVRLEPVTQDYLTSGVHIDTVIVNNRPGAIKDTPNHNTVGYLQLMRPLLSGDSISLSIKWHYDVSEKSFREGVIDSTTYFLGYFYPRIAVYDDYQGWDQTEFNDQLEFYNDFNSYKLDVQAPKNFIVWATGTLQNTDAVLQPEYAQKLKRSMTSDSINHIITKKDLLSKKNITAQKAVNHWKYIANNISDVAFGISDHYVWDATSVIVDSGSNRRASVQAAYNDTAADFGHVAYCASHTLSSLSDSWPGVPYPYEKTIVFQGNGNMEYPMMANDESFRDTLVSTWVTAHEIAHSYMPFYMGINETRYGFMDEGWTTTFELLLLRDFFGNVKEDSFYKAYRIDKWMKNPLSGDIPIIIPGTNLNGFTDMTVVEYSKPSLGYLAAKDLLGDSLFKKCLHEFMRRWHGKHPIPWDMFYTFNDVGGTDLNWFWKNWFYSDNYIDLAISKVERATDGYKIIIDNVGGMAIPYDALITYTDHKTEILHATPMIWKGNEQQAVVTVKSSKAIRSVEIKTGIFEDANEADNEWIGAKR